MVCVASVDPPDTTRDQAARFDPRRAVTPAFRHAILRISGQSWLHPAQVKGNPHASALPKMFDRGHLDHIALAATSATDFEALRRRLVEHGASNGEVEDLGAFRATWFKDPDGMRGELVLVLDPELRGVHEPRKIAAAAQA
jgi:hypothetical protein